jgi:hypothetical protein
VTRGRLARAATGSRRRARPAGAGTRRPAPPPPHPRRAPARTSACTAARSWVALRTWGSASWMMACGQRGGRGGSGRGGASRIGAAGWVGPRGAAGLQGRAPQRSCAAALPRRLRPCAATLPSVAPPRCSRWTPPAAWRAPSPQTGARRTEPAARGEEQRGGIRSATCGVRFCAGKGGTCRLLACEQGRQGAPLDAATPDLVGPGLQGLQRGWPAQRGRAAARPRERRLSAAGTRRLPGRRPA